MSLWFRWSILLLAWRTAVHNVIRCYCIVTKYSKKLPAQHKNDIALVYWVPMVNLCSYFYILVKGTQGSNSKLPPFLAIARSGYPLLDNAHNAVADVQNKCIFPNNGEEKSLNWTREPNLSRRSQKARLHQGNHRPPTPKNTAVLCQH